MSRPLRRLLTVLGGVALLLALLAGAFFASPWPGALAIRLVLDRGAQQASDALRKHVPPGIVEHLGEVYDAADPDARLDIYLPPPPADGAASTPPPVVVWVHGGGWVSGRRGDIGHYARVLAGRGLAVVAVDYSLAPGARYPTPVRQVNTALRHLSMQASRWHIDPDRIVLAGHSAGAHIAAQVANTIALPAYAVEVGVVPGLASRQLRGVVLFGGPYDLRKSRLDGPAGLFLRTALWAYSGQRDFLHDRAFAAASVIDHLTPDFPPAFISAGNADPLLRQSHDLAVRLSTLRVRVETLFFPDEQVPALGPLYPFDLDQAAGRRALDGVVGFVIARTGG